MNTEVVALANEYYEANRRENNTHVYNIRMAERHFKLKPGQLRYYRANRKKRKVDDINLIHNGGTRKK